MQKQKLTPSTRRLFDGEDTVAAIAEHAAVNAGIDEKDAPSSDKIEEIKA